MARSARKSAEPVEVSEDDHLNSMSVVELNALVDRALAVRDGKIGSARKEFIDRVRVEAEGLGLSLGNLSPRAEPKRPKGDRKPAAVKYKDEETGATWSGRGKMAKVFEDRLKQGRKIEEFLVNQAAE